MKRIFLLSIIASLFLFSCEKENVQEMNVDQMVDEIKSAQIEGDKQRCAELVYPVELAMHDGTLITVEEEGGVKAAMEEWHKNNPDKKERPTLVYPVEMIFKGKVFTINNEKQMTRIRMACGGKKGKEDEGLEKRIYGFFAEIGIPKEKMEASMRGLIKAIDEAKLAGKEYQMSDELRTIFSNRIGLTDVQIGKIQWLAIKIAMGTDKDSIGEKGKGNETMTKRIYNYLDEIGIPKEKMEATLIGLKKAIGEAKQQGKEYKMSDELVAYFSDTVGLTDGQIGKIQVLAVRILSNLESNSKKEKGKGDEAFAKRIYKYFAEIEIPKEKMDACITGLKKAIGEAKQAGKEYTMSDDLRSYFSNRIELTDTQIEKIQGLAIRIALS